MSSESESTPPETTEELVGQLVGQRYQVLERLSSQPDFTEYLGRQSALDRFVTLKVFNNSPADHGSAGSFHRHARALARLRHPQVVTLYDHGLLDTGERFIVEEHVKRANLIEVLRGRTLTLEELFHIGVQVLSALEESHRLGILHRRVHPSCVFLQTDVQPWEVRVGNFAFPSEDDEGLRDSNTVAGYGIPEAQKGEALTERSDLFCVGKLLEEVWDTGCGKESKKATELENWSPKAGQHFQEFIAQMTASAPSERPQSARSARRALSAFLMAVKSGPGSRADERPAAKSAELVPKTLREPVEVSTEEVTEKSLPQWKYIVALGLISATAIGLVILQQAAHEGLGTEERKTPLPTPVEVRAEAHAAHIVLTSRFRDLLRGRIVSADWFASGPHWMTSQPGITRNDLGVSPSSSARGEDFDRELKGLRAQATYGGLNDKDLRHWVSLEWFAIQKKHPSASQTSLQSAVSSVIAWDAPGLSEGIYFFLLGHTFESEGHLDAALNAFERGSRSASSSVWSERCQIRMIPIALSTGRTSAARKMIDSQMNSSIALHRQIANVYLSMDLILDGQARRAIDTCITFIETIASTDAQRESLRTRAIELLALAGGQSDDQGVLAKRYLSTLGGTRLVEYYRPLIELSGTASKDMGDTGGPPSD